jgi:hypothetical protein
VFVTAITRVQTVLVHMDSCCYARQHTVTYICTLAGIFYASANQHTLATTSTAMLEVPTELVYAMNIVALNLSSSNQADDFEYVFSFVLAHSFGVYCSSE